MITHVVFFKAKPELNRVKILDKLEQMLMALNSSIKELNRLEFGIDFNKSDAAYDAVLYSTFKTKADLNAYQIHPEHIKVKKYIAKVTSKRAVVDYIK